ESSDVAADHEAGAAHVKHECAQLHNDQEPTALVQNDVGNKVATGGDRPAGLKVNAAERLASKQFVDTLTDKEWNDNMNITTKTVSNNWTEYTLSNDHGMSISILEYGGIITEMITLNQSNEPENIVLRYQNYKDYEDNPHFLGAIIGRVGGRI